VRKIADSPVFDRFARPLVSVARPGGSLGFAVALGGIGLFGAVVFLSLSHSRGATPIAHPAAPHPIVLAQVTPSPRPEPQVTTAPPPPAYDPTAAQQAQAKLSSPAMIVDLSDPPSAALPSSPSAATTGAPPEGAPATKATGPSTNMNDDPFAVRVSRSSAETTVASQLHDTKLMVPQGTVVPAVLETGINSDLPGFVRAVVSRDVHGFDGTTVLIPRGSKLIGQYKSAVAAGYSRAFVVWSRLLTPDAVSVDIGSPTTDTLGQGGIAGETNSHFFQRFGAAILLSVLTSGLDAAANSVTSHAASVIIDSPQQANNVAALALQKYIDVPTTIVVPQGTPVRVFVSRDLDFSGVPQPKQ
jgi:type IV secretion system protein VirB10